jgi:predicted TIM-barrel fold metal-dependent hydrolase
MTHEKWLKLTLEDVIDPELPICDPHHHLWDHPGDRYLMEELLKDTASGHNIVSTVFVDCRSGYRQSGPQDLRPVGETEYVISLTANRKHGTPDVAAGIVSFADLTLGAAVVPVLEAHIAAGKDRFKGIRNMGTWEDDPAFALGYNAPKKGILLDSKLREGFSYLKRYGLSFETMVFHTQLMDVVDLARMFPDTTIILNHIGAPLGIGSYAQKHQEVFNQWKRSIAELSTCQNVLVKLGGIGMDVLGFDWNKRAIPPGSAEVAELTKPYILWCIDKFGSKRCMFESNFPVDRKSFSYNILWNTFKRITRDFSRDERLALFHDTAVKAYKIKPV